MEKEIWSRKRPPGRKNNREFFAREKLIMSIIKKETSKKHIFRFRAVNRDIFDAIKSGKKKIETRAGSVRYQSISEGDIAVLICGKSKFRKKIGLVNKFPSIDSLLKKYKPSDINPNIKTAAELEKMYSSFPGYHRKIKEYGLIVIGLKNK
jgi:ASC-1-like (ASCH) protein